MLATSLLLLSVCGADPQPVCGAERIFPPNAKHNHASSIVETPEGDLLAVWFHGSGERSSDDVQLLGARKRAGASAWSEPFPMADTPDLPDCNPVLFIDPRGTLWLFWVAIQNNEWGSALLKYRTAVRYTLDGPPIWDWQDVIHCRPTNLETPYLALLDRAAREHADALQKDPRLAREIDDARRAATDKLSQRLGWMTRVHPLLLPDQTLMLGLYSDVFNCALAAFTRDWGKTWTFSEPILELGNIQPSFVLRRDGRIAAFMRDNGLPHRVRYATSADSGMTWSPVTPLELPNPGSSVECIALASQRWLLVCNDTENGRHRLTAYLSDDEGDTWKWKRPLEDHPEGAASASYPSVIQTRDGLVHCTYSFTSKEFTGSTIMHIWLNELWVEQGPDGPNAAP